MRVDGFNHGNEAIVYVHRAFQAVTSGSMKTSIPLDRVPSRLNGMKLVVKGLLIKIPQPTFNIAAGKILDGVSMAQFFASITLAMATDAPPTQAGSINIIDGVDGYRCFHALSYLSHRPVIYGKYSGLQIIAGKSNTDQLTSVAVGVAPQSQRAVGWLNEVGPFGEAANAAVGAWGAERPVFYLPFGERYDEPGDRFGVPAEWLNGEYNSGRSRKTAGRLDLTLGTSIDGTSVTAWGSQGFDVLAVCERVPEDQIPCPTVLNIKAGNQVGKFELAPGVRRMFSLMKDLNSTGDVATEDYTTVFVRDGGTTLTEETVADELLKLQQKHLRSDSPFHVIPTQATYTNSTAQDRVTRCGTPLLLHRGSPLHAPGSIDGNIEVDVKTTGETSYKYLDVVEVPNHGSVLAKALSVNGRPGYVAQASTKNGNREVPESIAKALPHKLVLKG
jgi:hypothetical protein